MKFFKIYLLLVENTYFFINVSLQNCFNLVFNVLIKSKFRKCNYYILRFIKVFVKNKYPRNRQWSKNVIYLGILFNIIILYSTFFFCYHFLLNLEYLWWLIYLVITFYFLL